MEVVMDIAGNWLSSTLERRLLKEIRGNQTKPIGNPGLSGRGRRRGSQLKIKSSKCKVKNSGLI
jgi:hypothetical protein